MADHFTKETEGKIGTVFTVEDARKAHHLASADPERDGVMTGHDHEVKYGLERATAAEEPEPVGEAGETPPAPPTE